MAAGTAEAGRPDTEAALGAGRSAGKDPWCQSHGNRARARLLRLEETGRGRPRKTEVQQAGVRRVASPLGIGKQGRFELDNGAGVCLRVQLAGYDTADLEALVRGFWNAR